MKSGTPRVSPPGTKPAIGETIFGEKVNTVFSNHFSILAGPTHIRFLFGEGFGTGSPNDTNWHTAVAMPVPDAIELHKMLTDFVGRYTVETGVEVEEPGRPNGE